MFPQSIIYTYKRWNRFAKLVARLSRIYLIAVCFYIVSVFPDSTGSILNLKRPTDRFTLWKPWLNVDAAKVANLTDADSIRTNTNYWITSFTEWAIKSERYWAFSLLPAIIFLRQLKAGHKRGFPTSIYTLY
jgi:hypothetical protein